MIAVNSSTQPKIIRGVMCSFRKITEQSTPNTDSSDRNSDAEVAVVYFWQTF